MTQSLKKEMIEASLTRSIGKNGKPSTEPEMERFQETYFKDTFTYLIKKSLMRANYMYMYLLLHRMDHLQQGNLLASKLTLYLTAKKKDKDKVVLLQQIRFFLHDRVILELKISIGTQNLLAHVIRTISFLQITGPEK